MIYYISDLHFMHKNIIELAKRPFNDLEDMREQIIKRWNKKVKPGDEVYILGDIFFNWKVSNEQYDILDRLNGKKDGLLETMTIEKN